MISIRFISCLILIGLYCIWVFQQSLLEGCTVIWNERTLQLSRLAGNQLYYSVSVSSGLKFLIREFGWARAGRGSSSTSSWHTDEVVFGNLKAWDKSTMTSTNMFQGLDTGSKPSSRWGKKMVVELWRPWQKLRTVSCFDSSRPVSYQVRLLFCDKRKWFCNLTFGHNLCT